VIEQASTLFHVDQEVDIAAGSSFTSCDGPEHSDFSRTMSRSDLKDLLSL